MLLARHPSLYWLTVAALAAVAAGSIVVGNGQARRTRESWGATRQVIVADRAINPGEALDGVTAVRQLPLALVPRAAISAVEPGRGRYSRSALARW